MRVDDDQVVFFNRKMLVFNQEFSTSLTDVKEFREGMVCGMLGQSSS